MTWNNTRQFHRWINGSYMEFGTTDFYEGLSSVEIDTKLKKCFCAIVMPTEDPHCKPIFWCDGEIIDQKITVWRDDMENDPSDFDPSIDDNTTISYIFIGY